MILTITKRNVKCMCIKAVLSSRCLLENVKEKYYKTVSTLEHLFHQKEKVMRHIRSEFVPGLDDWKIKHQIQINMLTGYYWGIRLLM